MPLRSRILIGLAALCAVLALLGAWVDRQLLNTDDWTDTSTALLREDAIRDPLADAIAAQVADGSRATAALESVLPPRLAPLAPEAGALVREAAQRGTERVLAGDRVQDVWVALNRATHDQLVALVDGDGRLVGDDGVVLDLRPLAAKVAQEAGFSGDRIESLPGTRGRIVLLRPDQLDTLQTAGKLLDTLSWLPAVLALLLYALAIWLARTAAAHRRALLATGVSLVAAALLVLVVRRIAGHELVAAVAGDGAYVPAAEAVWRIATTLLAELAVVVLLAGLVAALGAWLAGPGRLAIRLRGALAPALAGQPEATVGFAAVAYLALVAWGPLTVLRRPLAIVVLGVLLVVGIVVLRVQVKRELAAGGAIAAAGADDAAGAIGATSADDAASAGDAGATGERERVIAS